MLVICADGDALVENLRDLCTTIYLVSRATGFRCGFHVIIIRGTLRKQDNCRVEGNRLILAGRSPRALSCVGV